MDLDTTRKLNNGTAIPMLGLGVFQAKNGGETARAVQWALEAGYRHIDTAAAYRNEDDVARGIKASGVPREEIFITTKLPNDAQREGSQREIFKESLRLLGTDYVDLYLIHWPVKGKYIETWKIMEEIYDAGGARAIGVSNFLEHHLDDVMAVAKTPPAVDQIELHPHFTQEPLVAYCQKLGIAPEAWSPLGGTGGSLLADPALAQIGQKYGKSPAQVVLRWDLQRGVITIPKSVHQDRIMQNTQLFDFELTEADMAAVSALHTGKRVGADPDNFNF